MKTDGWQLTKKKGVASYIFNAIISCHEKNFLFTVCSEIFLNYEKTLEIWSSINIYLSFPLQFNHFFNNKKKMILIFLIFGYNISHLDLHVLCWCVFLLQTYNEIDDAFSSVDYSWHFGDVITQRSKSGRGGNLQRTPLCSFLCVKSLCFLVILM